MKEDREGTKNVKGGRKGERGEGRKEGRKGETKGGVVAVNAHR
jgi:hypothetical protein